VRALLKKYRDLLIIGALLLLPLVTYLAYAKRGRELTFVDRAVLWTTRPIERGMTGAVGGVIDLWQGWIGLHGVREENLELRREVLRLREQVAMLAESEKENERLEQMLKYSQSAPGTMVTAPIIGEGPALNLLTLRVGKGSQDGLAKGMAVVYSLAEGTPPRGAVVGRVLSVGTTSASVLRLEDANFAVPVRVQGSRARAKVVGMGEGRPLALTQALRNEQISDGDLLVTSGTDGIFPKGLVVGKVVNVVRPNSGMFLTAEVIPAVETHRLEEIMVLTSVPELDELPAAALQRP